MKPVPLREAVDASFVGGKAAQLGAAIRATLPVPDGAALPWPLVDAVAAPDARGNRSPETAEAGRTLGPALADLLARLGPPVAVRSSAVGEDSAGASFAGQHATVLNVRSPRALLEAVRTVHASARSEAALAYRRRLGISGEARIGVVVQRMAVPEVAGVLFTRDPLTGADECVIEATWGVGEAVVAGLVAPDRYRVSRAGEILERTPGLKDVAVRLREDGGTEEAPVPPDRVEVLCLGDADLARLHELAGRCEAVFGGGHDIEWAFADGRLWLLQRRPITTGGGR